MLNVLKLTIKTPQWRHFLPVYLDSFYLTPHINPSALLCWTSTTFKCMKQLKDNIKQIYIYTFFDESTLLQGVSKI